MIKESKIKTCRISFSAVFEDEVRRHYQEFTRDIKMTRADRLATGMALNELALNAIEHSGSKDNHVFIQFQFFGNQLRIGVRDRGRGFNQINQPKNAFRGNGLNMVRALCDGVQIHPTSAGVQISITKKLWRPKIGGFSI